MRRGLLDAVVPTPRWDCTDSAVPVHLWRELLGDKIAIFGGIEARTIKATGGSVYNSKAYAAAFYAGGADGIYFNNHEYDTDRNRNSWMITRESCLEGHREFVVTRQDVFADGNPQYKPLPMEVNGYAKTPLDVGKITKKAKVIVVIDWEGDTAPLIGAGCKTGVASTAFDSSINIYPSMIPHTPLSYNISGISTENALTITFFGNGTVHYINVIIDN